MNPLKNKYTNIYSRMFAILLLVTIGACSTTKALQHHRLEQIESKLTRGISTKADVLKVFGKRDGFGTVLMPSDPIIREMWYYEDIKFSQGLDFINAEQRIKILLIYFKDRVYDGYMWFATKAEKRVDPVPEVTFCKTFAWELKCI